MSEAIICYEKAREIGVEFCNLDLEAESLHHLGLCKAELWEVQEAIKIFEQVSSISENTYVHEHAVLAWTRLAFFNSYLGNDKQAKGLIERVNIDLPKTNLRIRGKAYAMLEIAATYKNLGEYEEAVEKYRQAINYAMKTRFIHVKAMALIGLAVISREQGYFETSLSYHAESITITRCATKFFAKKVPQDEARSRTFLAPVGQYVYYRRVYHRCFLLCGRLAQSSNSRASHS